MYAQQRKTLSVFYRCRGSVNRARFHKSMYDCHVLYHRSGSRIMVGFFNLGRYKSTPRDARKAYTANAIKSRMTPAHSQPVPLPSIRQA